MRLNLRDPAALHVGAGDFPGMRLNRLAPALYAIFNLTPPPTTEWDRAPCRKRGCNVDWRQSCLPTWSGIADSPVRTRWARGSVCTRSFATRFGPRSGARGQIIRIKGDGILVEFASAVEAVYSAIALQQAVARRNAAIADEQRIRLRIGINVGDIMSDDEDLHGDGVNVAARLEPLAEPGGICISAAVHEYVRAKLPYPFEDRGSRILKNIANPMWIYVLGPETIAELPIAAPAPDLHKHAWRRYAAPLAIAMVGHGAVDGLAALTAEPNNRFAYHASRRADPFRKR